MKIIETEKEFTITCENDMNHNYHVEKAFLKLLLKVESLPGFTVIIQKEPTK